MKNYLIRKNALNGFVLFVILFFFSNSVFCHSLNVNRISISMVEGIADYIIIEVPYQKPHFYNFVANYLVQFRSIDGEIFASSEKKFFVWKRNGEELFPISKNGWGKDWRKGQIKIFLRFGKKYVENTGWLPIPILLKQLHVKMLCPTVWFKGYRHSLRVIALKSRDGKPVSIGKVSAKLQSVSDKTSYPLFEEILNKEGTISPQFSLENIPNGKYHLSVTVISSFDKVTLTKDISVQDEYKLVLFSAASFAEHSVEVPIRAFFKHLPLNEMISNEPIIFSIFDSKQELIDKQEIRTDKNGVAIYKFISPTETASGRYIIKAQARGRTVRNFINISKFLQKNDDILLIRTEKHNYEKSEKLKFRVFACNSSNKVLKGKKIVIRLIKPNRLAKVFKTVWGKTNRNGIFNGVIKLQDVFGGRHLEKIPLSLQLAVYFEKKSRRKKLHLNSWDIDIYPDQLKISVEPKITRICPDLSNQFILTLKNLENQPVISEGSVERSWNNTPISFSTNAKGIFSFKIVPPQETFTLSIKGEKPLKFLRNFTFSKKKYRYDSLLIDMNNTQDNLSIKKQQTDKEILLYLDTFCDGQLINTKSTLMNNDSRFVSYHNNSSNVNRITEISSSNNSCAKKISAYHFASSFSSKKSLYSGVYIEKNKKEADYKTILTETIDQRNILHITEPDSSNTRFFYLDFFSIPTFPTNKKFEITDIISLLNNKNNIRKINKLSKEENPVSGFIINSPEPAALWMNIFQHQINSQAANIWKRLPISQQKDFHINNESVIKDGYIKSGDLLDPWGKPLVINLPGNKIYSLGPDGIDNTNDEIFANGGWFLIKKTEKDTRIKPQQAGLAVMLYDSKSLPVPSATVTLSNPSSQIIITPNKNNSSIFFKADIPPDKYSIKFEGYSLQTLELPNIELNAGSLTYVRASLRQSNFKSNFTVLEEGIGDDAEKHKTDNFSSKVKLLHQVGGEFLFSKKVKLENGNADVKLNLNDNLKEILVRVTSLLDNDSGLSSHWEKISVLRKISVKYRKYVNAKLSKSKKIYLKIETMENSPVTLKIIPKKLPWIGSCFPKFRSVTVRKGKSKQIFFTILPILQGEQKLTFSINNEIGTFSRQQKWVVTGENIQQKKCKWLFLTSSGESKIKLLTKKKAKTPLNLTFELYKSPLSFLREADKLLEMDSQKGNIGRSLFTIVTRLEINGLIEKLYKLEFDSKMQLDKKQINKVKSKIKSLFRKTLTYQKSGGGFAAKKGAEADAVLTALLLKLFEDLDNVITIDRKIILSNRYWLLVNQNENGFWCNNERDNAFIIKTLAEMHTGIENIQRSINYFQKHPSSDPVVNVYISLAIKNLKKIGIKATEIPQVRKSKIKTLLDKILFEAIAYQNNSEENLDELMLYLSDIHQKVLLPENWRLTTEILSVISQDSLNTQLNKGTLTISYNDKYNKIVRFSLGKKKSVKKTIFLPNFQIQQKDALQTYKFLKIHFSGNGFLIFKLCSNYYF